MRLIDADELGIGKANPDVFENKAYAEGWNGAIDIINAVPAVDAVEVVRCKDCEYSYEDIDGLTCSYGVCVDCELPPDFYCAEGKRKEKKE